MPFIYNGKQVISISPEGKETGIEIGDKILAMNGQTLESESVWGEELSKNRESGQINLTIERQIENEQIQTKELTVPLIKIEKDFSFYAKLVVGFVFVYFVPLFCILIGFWVVFVRVHDFLAWLLLFLLLGFSCIGLESYGSRTLIGAYAQIFFSTWAVSMLLFGIYFPERLNLDIKFPWLKWIIIVPLGLQMILIFLNLFSNFTGIGLTDFLKPFNGILNLAAVPLNMESRKKRGRLSIAASLMGEKSSVSELL